MIATVGLREKKMNPKKKGTKYNRKMVVKERMIDYKSNTMKMMKVNISGRMTSKRKKGR